MSDLKERTIVLLGRTGHGKSSSGNIILGDSSSTKFKAKCSPVSVTRKCEVQMGLRGGKVTNIIDTPGFFDTFMTDKDLKTEVLNCIATCAPGPYAFVIVLSLVKFTEEERAAVAEITRSFGEDALKYSAVLFTHGDDLDEGQTIEQFVEQSKELKELVEKCGGRCHVIDNKCWNQENGDKNNRVQVEKLLNTIEEMVRQNGGGCYTNEMLKAVEGAIQREEEEIRKKNPNETSASEIRVEAIRRFIKKFLAKCAGLAVGTLVGALLGVGSAVTAVIALIVVITENPSGAVMAAAVTATTGVGVAGGIVAGAGVIGAIGGGIVGFQAVEDGDTVVDAVKNAVKANVDNVKKVVAEVNELASELTEGIHSTTSNKGY